jgi:hypothetical protein
VIKAQQAELLKKNKETLKKEAQEINLKGNCHINGASHDAPKEVIVAQLLEKKIVQLFPSLEFEIPADTTTTTNKISLNDKFHLINIIVSDELSNLSLRSKESATCAELDAGLVGHSSPF